MILPQSAKKRKQHILHRPILHWTSSKSNKMQEKMHKNFCQNLVAYGTW